MTIPERVSGTGPDNRIDSGAGVPQSTPLGGEAGLRAELKRAQEELGAAQRTIGSLQQTVNHLLAGHAGPAVLPPPEFELAYGSPLPDEVTVVTVNGALIALDRDQVGRRPAEAVWGELARHLQ